MWFHILEFAQIPLNHQMVLKLVSQRFLRTTKIEKTI